jgi:hypothetical protein
MHFAQNVKQAHSRAPTWEWESELHIAGSARRFFVQHAVKSSWLVKAGDVGSKKIAWILSSVPLLYACVTSFNVVGR